MKYLLRLSINEDTEITPLSRAQPSRGTRRKEGEYSQLVISISFISNNRLSRSEKAGPCLNMKI